MNSTAIESLSRDSIHILKGVLESSGTPECLLSPDRHILLANTRFLSAFPYRDHQLQGVKIDALFPALADDQEFVAMVGGAGTGALRTEFSHRGPDGSESTVSSEIDTLRDLSGNILAYVFRVRETGAERHPHSAQEAVYRIAQAADHASTLDELFRFVHESVSLVMPARNFYIALYDRVSDILSFPYFVDEVDTPLDPQPPGRGLTAYILRTGKSLLCDQAVQEDLQNRGEAELVGVPSPIWLGVPLIIGGKTIGAMVVQHYSDASAYGVREQQLLEFVSSQVARAIERKRSEEVLRRSEERYRRFVDQISEGIWRAELVNPVGTNLPPDKQIECIERDSRVAECNSVMAHMQGLSHAEEMIGRSLADLIALRSPKGRDILSRFVEGGYRLVEAESLEHDRSGMPRCFVRNLVGIIERGKLTSVWGTQRDVTERRLAEERLRLSESNLAAAQRITHLGSWELDLINLENFAQNPLRWSDEVFRIFGHEPGALAISNEDFFRAVHPDDRGRIVEELSQAIHGKKPYSIDHRIILPDGQERVLHERADLIMDAESGRPLRMVGTVQDITERTHAEQTLRTSEKQYRSLFEESHDGILVTTPEGRFLDVNPTALRIFGYTSREEFLGVSAPDLYANPSDRDRFRKLIAEQGFVRDLEFEIRRKDGGTGVVVESSTPVMNERNEIIAFRGFIRDITERKRLEDQLRQAQKMEGIGTLAGGIAHDFNNLLGIILGYAQMLPGKSNDQERVAKCVEAIQEAVTRGADLVRQLLTFARRADPSFTTIDPNGVVEELVRMLGETFPKSIVLETALERPIPGIVADTTQLHQALLNLCVNSRDAMLDRKKGTVQSGALTLATRSVPGEQLRRKFPPAAAARYVEIVVKDNGSGMDATTRARIFEPFYTTKDLGKGTGLGLSVVYGVIKSHHGFVDVESSPGEGTAFHLYFPASDQQAAEHPAKETTEAVIGGSETVLVVEDEEMLLELLQTMLAGQGYKVLIAKDGQEGLDLFRAHAAEVSLVLSDMGLPKLGGWEMLKSMQEIRPDVKAILASGYFDPNLKMDMLRAGAKDFVQKPYVPEEILIRIRQIIDDVTPA